MENSTNMISRETLCERFPWESWNRYDQRYSVRRVAQPFRVNPKEEDIHENSFFATLRSIRVWMGNHDFFHKKREAQHQRKPYWCKTFFILLKHSLPIWDRSPSIVTNALRRKIKPEITTRMNYVACGTFLGGSCSDNSFFFLPWDLMKSFHSLFFAERRY